MKTSILVILFLYCSQILSQIDSQNKINHREFLKERKTNSSIPLTQRESSFEANMFPNNDSRRGVNKTALNNEFLLIEQIEQRWDSTGWVNSGIWSQYFGPDYGGRHTYQYNESNYIIEDLYLDWDGSSWVNYTKNTYTYDENNNMIEDLVQYWDSTSWVNNYEDYLYL